LGALLGLDAQGAVHTPPSVVDLSPILAPLDDEFAALNIEGAVVVGEELRLFQRGNKRHTANAIIRFKLSALLDALGSRRTSAIKPFAIHARDLGQIAGIPLTFTDAAALPVATWYSVPSQRIPTTLITMGLAWAQPSEFRATTELCVACTGSTRYVRSKALTQKWMAMS
jgi:hypothetical protein